MITFLLKKLLRALVLLWGVTLVTFLLIHLVPGSPWAAYSTDPVAMQNISMDRSTMTELNRRFGLDQPLWRQYTRYFIGDFTPEGGFDCGAICGKLGPSIRQRGRSVQDVLFAPPENQTFWQSRFGYSIRLILLGSLIAIGLGLPLGTLIALRPHTAAGRAVSVALAALISIPNFVLGLLTIIVFASWLKIMNVLPDFTHASSWIIPALVLAVMPMAGAARMTRAALMNIQNEDYVRTARAKGLTRMRVLLVHIMRNALVPISTYLGPTLVEMLTGLLVVENLYSFPGFGNEYWGAVLNLDYPMVLGLTLVYALAILFVNAAVEILCEMLDPRLRIPRQRSAAG